MNSSTTIRTVASRRSLLLHDGLVFVTLCGVTVVLFALTFLLFRSFENHREELGDRWAERGRADLAQGRPETAVGALRTALTYKDALPEQLLLAQALAQAGHTEEAMNYFVNLREGRPGDGFINLQLARLARRQNDPQQADDFYHASIFGDWQGDGAQRRREVRLELASYLAQQKDPVAARNELLIAAGNTPETAESDALFGDQLATINEKTEALSFYRSSLAKSGRQRQVLGKAGCLAFDTGNYADASRLLNGALEEHGGNATAAEKKQWAELAAQARRVPELSLSRELPATERADHLLAAAAVAQRRLAACVPPSPVVPLPTSGNRPGVPAPALAVAAPPASPALQTLQSRWSAAATQLRKRTLERDAALEDDITQLINDTEVQTQPLCGPAQGDDALLLRLATGPHTPQ